MTTEQESVTTQEENTTTKSELIHSKLSSFGVTQQFEMDQETENALLLALSNENIESVTFEPSVGLSIKYKETNEQASV